MGQWVAAIYTYGLIFAPRATRLIASTFAVITLADALHQGYETANALGQQASKQAQQPAAGQGEQPAS